MRQPDLLPRVASPIRVEPGASEPRLWIRRFIVWRRQGERVREIGFRPGLNIIWSPDASLGTGVIGHGGGKTMLCRMLRYCLGEDSFAPEGQRARIWEAFPEGFVTADIRLDGQDWLVARSLAQRRRDFALKGGSIADLEAHNSQPTTLEPLMKALTAAFVSEAGELMPPRVGEENAWTAALAWLSRDQECRFDKLLHWRDPGSDSRSPIAGTSEGDRLELVRAFIKALTPEEQNVRRQEEDLNQTLARRRTELGHREWELRTLGIRLAQRLSLAQAPGTTVLDAEILQKTAREYLLEVLGASGGVSFSDLASARARRNEAYDTLQVAQRDLSVAEVQREEKARVLSYQEGELGPLSAQLARGETPVCPVCKVAIDQVLAEGCHIALEPCDLGALRAEYERKGKEATQTKADLNTLGRRIPELQSAASLAKQSLGPLDKAVTALEAAQNHRSEQLRLVERVVDDAQRFADAVADRLKLISDIEVGDLALTRLKETSAAHRAQAAETITLVARRFDETLRALVPGEVSGALKLDGNGLSLRVSMGGDRTSAAIESLKIVAFDLAVLIRSIEGETRLPAFLIHDSPREADLGGSIYALLFHLAAELEAAGDAPCFQYLVTTTTAPPESLRGDPWLRLELHGAPPEERLLRVDL